MIKSAFGFGPDAYEYPDDTDASSGAVDTAVAADIEAQDAAVVEGLHDLPTLPEISPEMKARIFEGAVAIFNEALPGFLQQSVDPKVQAKRIADSIDQGVDDYLNSLMLKAEQYAEGKLKTATDAAVREAERLRADMQQIEQQRATLREQQLSADRRRRALTDRVNDLEAKLASAEAEREQFDLEKRSLLNKLRVAEIDGTATAEHIHTADNSVELSTMTARIAELEAQLAQANERAEAAEAASTTASREAEDLRTQNAMSQEMYVDLQKQYAQERDDRTRAQAELAEAQKLVARVETLQLQLGQVEEIIRRRDERISAYKQKNKKLREQLAVTEAALHQTDTLPDNGLFSDPAAEYGTPVDNMEAIEDEFECPEWFTSQPDPGEVSPLLQPSADFGYQEPPRKPRRPENDAQLSLF